LIRRLLVGVLALAACGAPRSGPPVPSAELAATAAPAAPASPSRPDDDLLPDDPPAPPPPNAETVTIKLVAEARRQAHVLWGRKDLGVAPLELTRPRGSGPLDLLVLAPGALPLHTRVFTDRNETLSLRIYSEKEGSGLLGWTPPEASPDRAGDKKPRR
jgi:hypothetical protein